MLRFDGEVALITGGGRGMGREHALLLASRGAKIVVNDFGVAMSGAAMTETPADEVVAEIRAAGGEAIADTNDVSSPAGARAMVRAAIDAWGRIDIIVHNAGIVTFAPLAEMPYEDFRKLVSVHLDGGFLVTQAAWPHMVRQKHGRVILISSQAGLAGLPNSAHYSAAKTAVTGLARAITLEGKEHGIHGNALDVLAYTRMMEDFFTGEKGREDAGVRLSGAQWWQTYVRPDIISPVVAWLAHRSCEVAGQIINTAAGRVCNQYLTMTQGFTDPNLTPESIAANVDKIFDRSGGTREFANGEDYALWQFAKLSEEAGVPPIPQG
ncbi:MAG TPA: SDR family NAD(P)-dependent oxidoreductase [Sphingobium sp.]|nr:SDR family NAD(P)-dependent oxidoreductase [Sphingobium sp.]